MKEGYTPVSKTMKDSSFDAIVKLDKESAEIIDQCFYLLEKRMNKALEDKIIMENKVNKYIALYGELPSNQNNASEEDPEN